MDIKKKNMERCNKCEYCMPRVDSCTQDGCVHGVSSWMMDEEDENKSHKCEGCVWGTFTGVSYKCSLPRCMPKLGNFNGVGKNG